MPRTIRELVEDIDRVELEILEGAASRLDEIRYDPNRADERAALKRVIGRALRALGLVQPAADPNEEEDLPR